MTQDIRPSESGSPGDRARYGSAAETLRRGYIGTGRRTLLRKRGYLAAGRLGLALGLGVLLLMGVVWSAQAEFEPATPPRPGNVSPQVWSATAGGEETEFLVILDEQASLDGAVGISNRERRLQHVHDALRDVALRAQAPLRAELDAACVDHRAFYIVNMVLVRGDRGLVVRLSSHSDVNRIAANPRVRQWLPTQELRLEHRDLAQEAPRAIEWGIHNINADDVWALGYTGTQVVVAGQDTGYDWEHPALIRQYRGYDGVTGTHDYNWHDAIHAGGGVCGADSPAPCDDHSHGTHTMGTMVGDDGGGNQIGVAPGARWIGCRNMDEGVGTPATYAECFEFCLAPHPFGGDPMTDGESSLAPHVINNSWTRPPSEGCDEDAIQMLQTVVQNVRAAGIVVIASAGNTSTVACGSVVDPPATFNAAFSVGATNSSDEIASFSCRGPVTKDGSGRRKPDVSAPGVGVRSSLPGGGYGSMNGTSMAGPHVAGAVALLWSAAPGLVGDVDGPESVIARTARPRTTSETCGDDEAGDVPNNVYGWGIVDALAAVRAATDKVAITKTAVFQPGIPVHELVYTLQVTNTSGITLTQLVLTDRIPISTTLAWAGGQHTYDAGVVSWTFPSLQPWAMISTAFGVTVSSLPRGARVVNADYGARAAEMIYPAMGVPVDVVVPWRVLLALVLRNWSP